MYRREIRKHVFCMLFLKEFHGGDELSEQWSFYLDEVKGRTDEETEYLYAKANGVLGRLADIDQMIRDSSEGWRLERMGKVDLALLRLALYEIYHEEDVPTKVAINEAVELAKEFGEERSASFVNGLLGKIERKEE